MKSLRLLCLGKNPYRMLFYKASLFRKKLFTGSSYCWNTRRIEYVAWRVPAANVWLDISLENSYRLTIILRRFICGKRSVGWKIFYNPKSHIADFEHYKDRQVSSLSPDMASRIVLQNCLTSRLSQL